MDNTDESTPHVAAVHLSEGYEFSKRAVESVELIAGLGVVGDVHSGARVKHRSRVAADPTQPNLRQVHLMATELFDQLAAEGYTVAPGDLGENLTTTGIDLVSLGTGSVLRIGSDVLLGVTGLRNPCGQIEGFQTGLLKRVVYRNAAGETVRMAGIMAVVLNGGTISPGDAISISAAPGEPIPLRRV